MFPIVLLAVLGLALVFGDDEKKPPTKPELEAKPEEKPAPKAEPKPEPAS